MNICAIVADELILLASLKQVLVLSIKIGAVIAQLRLNGPAEAPPLMDWRKRVIQVCAFGFNYLFDEVTLMSGL